MYDTIVIGGGIVGASVAYHLARDNNHTLLVDRKDPGQATAAGAGIISPETSRDPDPATAGFALRAAQYYPSLAEAVRNDGATDTGYAETGILVIDPPDRNAGEYERGRDRILAQRDRTNHPNPDRLYEVSGDHARELFPALGDVQRAIYYEDAARVDGRRFRAALVHAGQSHGLETRHGTAEHILTHPTGGVAGVRVDSGEIPADTVVVAGGAWSTTFGDQLETPLPVEPQRGQILHLDLGGIPTATWPLVNTFYGYYLVPWDDARVAAGATRETDSGFAPKTTAEGVHTVLTETLRMAPGLADAAIHEIRVGLRPMSPDGHPIVGPLPGVTGAYVATGHGPSGLTLGPYSGKRLAELVQGNESTDDLVPFSPARFQPA